MINILTITGKLIQCGCRFIIFIHAIQVKKNNCVTYCAIKIFFLCRALLVQGDQMVLQEKLVQMWVDQQFTQWFCYLNIIDKQFIQYVVQSLKNYSIEFPCAYDNTVLFLSVTGGAWTPWKYRRKRIPWLSGKTMLYLILYWTYYRHGCWNVPYGVGLMG